jgi:hypothetical protein
MKMSLTQFEKYENIFIKFYKASCKAGKNHYVINPRKKNCIFSDEIRVKLPKVINLIIKKEENLWQPKKKLRNLRQKKRIPKNHQPLNRAARRRNPPLNKRKRARRRFWKQPKM